MNLSEYMEHIFAGPDGSSSDSRFTFDVGEHVTVDGTFRAQITSRRNGYPDPEFNCWFPIYFVVPFEGESAPYPGGEDVGPSRIRRLGEDTA